MKKIIKDVLNDMSESQINLASDAARETVSSLISAALKTKGTYTEYGDDEIEEQKARATWVCSICGENTFEVDSDYIGSGTNHLGCEMKDWDEINIYADSLEDDVDHYTGPEPRVVDDAGVDIETGTYIGGSEEIDGAYTPDEYEGWEKVINDMDIPEGLKVAKRLSHQALEEGLQKQIYNEMTSDGLPEGGDTQAILESQKLAEEIVDNKAKKYIYESTDGGETIYKRKFGETKRELYKEKDDEG